MSQELSIEQYLDGKSREGTALFRGFAKMAQACGDDVAVSASRSAVSFKRNRAFAGGCVQVRQLEIAIDLLRDLEHECLRESVVADNGVHSHKLRITSTGDLYTIVDLLREAYETVGPLAS